MGIESNTIKIAIIGDDTVGKLSFANLLFSNPLRQQIRNRSSLGMDFGIQNITIAAKTYKFHVFVTGGGDALSQLRKKYYFGACSFFLVFDVSNIKTLENLSSYLQEIKDCVKSGLTPLLYIIGNKIDLRSSDKQCVDKEIARLYVDKLSNQNSLDISYNEISCKAGTNLEYLKSDFHKSLAFGLALGQF
ncbi:MAG: hypothetical protein HeimC2_29010 [Candidatus Heimdallarchaeota archaeon LC_2]|nr:MAG: hypothetical protein HeimC2_29010 [Candidatus Heimdallarchaeota archaeon LC_2]